MTVFSEHARMSSNVRLTPLRWQYMPSTALKRSSPSRIWVMDADATVPHVCGAAEPSVVSCRHASDAYLYSGLRSNVSESRVGKTHTKKSAPGQAAAEVEVKLKVVVRIDTVDLGGHPVVGQRAVRGSGDAH
jgi:hypothetical protein